MSLILVLIAGASGLAVLLGYFLPAAQSVQSLLLRWAMILSAAAMFVGAVHLLTYHLGKVRRREKNAVYSALLVASLVSALVLGLRLGPGHPIIAALVDSLIIPAEGAFMALLAVSLVAAAARLLRRRADLMAIVFVAVAIAVLLSFASFPGGQGPILQGSTVTWLTGVVSLAGARGMLLGIALGVIMTGLRVLVGADRPYGS
jgi:hypothetical protein